MGDGQAGDILVIDGKADITCALMGSIMIHACKKMGFGGVILDAAHRDTEELLEMGFPVYSVGANPNGPTKYVPGRINWPVSLRRRGHQSGRSDRRRRPDGVVVWNVKKRSHAGAGASQIQR